MAEDQKPPEKSVQTGPEHEPKAHGKPEAKANGPRLRRFKNWYGERKKWTVPASVLLLIILLAAIPFTRYNLAGLAVKHDLTFKVQDATSHTPVSGAAVSLGVQTAQTDSNGQATLRNVKAGHHKVTISKKYYRDSTVDVLSPVFGRVNPPSVELTATGRQVKITVKNLVNQNVLADVTIKVADITAKTDQKGTALVVLPAGIAEQKAQLSTDGFNDGNVTIKINGNDQDNSFTLAPAGKIYFLSKLSGKIDVVKTNLDGTDRQTVLAGTGNEDDRNTVLLASRDWKYLALLSRRAGNFPSLYAIDTSNDKLTTVDQGDASFTLAGWVDDNFVYKINRNNIQAWQPNAQALKSYNAETKKTTVLDQTNASGTSAYDYISEQIGDAYGYDGQVYYSKGWVAYNESQQASTKQATFNSVKPDGSSKKAIKSFAPDSAALSQYIYASIGLNLKVEKPDKIHAEFYDGTGNKFYVYSNGQFKADTSPNASDIFFADYPTFLQSPSGNNTFWSEPRDGKNTLFIGDEDGENGNQIATLSDYNTYGWFTDSYLLVSKNDSELYIMDKSGQQPAVKISDYHKPAVTLAGYGGGYGGL